MIVLDPSNRRNRMPNILNNIIDLRVLVLNGKTIDGNRLQADYAQYINLSHQDFLHSRGPAGARNEGKELCQKMSWEPLTAPGPETTTR